MSPWSVRCSLDCVADESHVTTVRLIGCSCLRGESALASSASGRALASALLLAGLLSLAACEDRTVAQARRVTADLFKDPDTVRFRALHHSKLGSVCGEVNGKNSYGAYAGYQRFIFRNGRSLLDDTDSDEGHAYFGVAWDLCRTWNLPAR